MIRNRRHQNPGADGPGLAQPRRKNEGQELRLVPDFGDGDQQCRGEEYFQEAQERR